MKNLITIIILASTILFSCSPSEQGFEGQGEGQRPYLGKWVANRTVIGLDTMEIKHGTNSKEIWLFDPPKGLICTTLGKITEEGVLGVSVGILGEEHICWEAHLEEGKINFRIIAGATSVWARLD